MRSPSSNGTSEGAGSAILTFLGGFHPQTQSLWLTDIANHHLAIAIVFILGEADLLPCFCISLLDTVQMSKSLTSRSVSCRSAWTSMSRLRN